MRAIASVTLSFGLVSIPVKLYSATDASAAIRFKLMSRAGARLRQQYVADPSPEPAAAPIEADDERPPAAPLRGVAGRGQAAAAPPDRLPPDVRRAPRAAAPSGAPAPAPPADAHAAAGRRGGGEDVDSDQEPDGYTDADDAADLPPARLERHEMVRGYEFEKGRFVLFSPAELKALEEASRDSIDIVAFIPDGAVDPIYCDKAYLVAPDKRGEKTYALLLQALQRSGRTALARWAWKGKEYVVQVRPAAGGLVLQQLFYADEVRLPQMLGLVLPPVGDAELQLALKLIEQGAQDAYDPTQFVDEEKQRILAAVEEKIAGGSVISHHARAPDRPSGQVIDLLETLRASLRPTPTSAPGGRKAPVRAGATGNAAGSTRSAAGNTGSSVVTRLPGKGKAAAKKAQQR